MNPVTKETIQEIWDFAYGNAWKSRNAAGKVIGLLFLPMGLFVFSIITLFEIVDALTRKKGT